MDKWEYQNKPCYLETVLLENRVSRGLPVPSVPFGSFKFLIISRKILVFSKFECNLLNILTPLCTVQLTSMSVVVAAAQGFWISILRSISGCVSPLRSSCLSQLMDLVKDVTLTRRFDVIKHTAFRAGSLWIQFPGAKQSPLNSCDKYKEALSVSCGHCNPRKW